MVPPPKGAGGIQTSRHKQCVLPCTPHFRVPRGIGGSNAAPPSAPSMIWPQELCARCMESAWGVAAPPSLILPIAPVGVGHEQRIRSSHIPP